MAEAMRVIVRYGAAGVQLNTGPDEPQTLEADGLTYQFRSFNSLIDLHRCLTAALAATDTRGER